MQQLISDLISLSRIEADKYKPPETILSLDMLVKDIENIFVERGISTLNVDLPETPMTACGDYSQLSQMLQNLVTNAIKYGHEDTPVIIKLRPSRSRNMARITITDQGDGIDPKHLPRLTERFYRIDSGRSRAIGGTGLGLSIVKHIVHRHGGQLEIDSVVGTGTKITISLPTTNADMDNLNSDKVQRTDTAIL
jgi:two-component system phosphate regulon sensor histidine kinase PhoR